MRRGHPQKPPFPLSTAADSYGSCLSSLFVLHDVWWWWACCCWWCCSAAVQSFRSSLLTNKHGGSTQNGHCENDGVAVGRRRIFFGAKEIFFVCDGEIRDSNLFLETRSGLIFCSQSLVKCCYAQRNLTLDNHFIDRLFSMDIFSCVLLIGVWYQEKQILFSLHEQQRRYHNNNKHHPIQWNGDIRVDRYMISQAPGIDNKKEQAE